jgi:hypothetical protein
MLTLARHFARLRSAYPADRLLVVFEVDGPIVDQRHIVRRRLLDYDRVHGTDHFRGVEVVDVDTDTGNLEPFFIRRGLAAMVRRDVLGWYRDQPSSPHHAPGTERPHPGVLEVIRWFQLQSSTFVGLNTSRPERMRTDTLRSLNALGRDLRVEFDRGLLHMHESGDHGDVIASKIEGLRAFTRAGYRPVAVVDHDPAQIRAMVEADDTGDILFLQTRTTSPSARLTGPRTAAGRCFDLTALVGEDDLPDQVQLVWHGVNDEANMREFLSSTVRWGELDVRRDLRQRLVLRHDSFERTPWSRDEPLLTLAAALEAFAGHVRGLKLDLKDGTDAVDEVLALLDAHGFDDDCLWFNASIETVGADSDCVRHAESHGDSGHRTTGRPVGPSGHVRPAVEKDDVLLATARVVGSERTSGSARFAPLSQPESHRNSRSRPASALVDPVGPSRVRYPTLRGERLASPTWDEVTVNRSGGTTSESGAPSSGRDAALNVARLARRHRPRHSPSQQTGHRRELETVARGRPVWRRRACGPPVGQEGHEGGEVWAFARRTMSSSPSSLSSKRHRRQVSFVVAPCGATPSTNEHFPPGGSLRLAADVP